MPRYESNQTILTFIRRLPAEFVPFSPSSVPVEGMFQVLESEVTYRNQKIQLRLCTRASDREDFLTLSIPLLYIGKFGSQALLQQLLAWNNGATDTLRFAMDGQTDTLHLLCFRPVVGLAFEEFQYCVTNMVTIARTSLAKLRQEFTFTSLQ